MPLELVAVASVFRNVVAQSPLDVVNLPLSRLGVALLARNVFDSIPFLEGCAQPLLQFVLGVASFHWVL